MEEHDKALIIGFTAISTVVAIVTLGLDFSDEGAPVPTSQQIVGDHNLVAGPHSVVTIGPNAAELERLVHDAVEGALRAHESSLAMRDAESARLVEQLRELMTAGLAQAARSDPSRAREVLEWTARGDADPAGMILRSVAAREDGGTEASKRRKTEALLGLAALLYDDRARDALTAVEQALTLDPGTGSTWELQGDLLLRLGRAEDAKASFEEAIAVAIASSDLELESDGYHGLGLAYKDLGQLERAERALRRALELDQKLGNIAQIAADYGGLGLVYRRMERFDDAGEAYLRALEISERLGRPGHIATACLNLGALYGMAKELNQAERYLERALAIFQELGDRQGQGQAKGNLGKVYMQRGEFESAERALLEAVAVAQELGLTRDAATGHASLGELYEHKGKPSAAREHYERAQRLYAELGDSQQQLDHTRRRLTALGR